jgi:hypothetical protein
MNRLFLLPPFNLDDVHRRPIGNYAISFGSRRGIKRKKQNTVCAFELSIKNAFVQD